MAASEELSTTGDTLYFDPNAESQLLVLSEEIRHLVNEALVVTTGQPCEDEYAPVDVETKKKPRPDDTLYCALSSVKNGIANPLRAARARIRTSSPYASTKLAVNLAKLSPEGRRILRSKCPNVGEYNKNDEAEGGDDDDDDDKSCYPDFGFRNFEDICSSSTTAGKDGSSSDTDDNIIISTKQKPILEVIRDEDR
jgi:hypothetical protein